jgi:hypothetical protein
VQALAESPGWRAFHLPKTSASSFRSSSRVAIDTRFWSFAMGTDDSDHPGNKLRQLLRDNEIDLSVAEGLRLIVAFKKIDDASDRRVLIELAERLAK